MSIQDATLAASLIPYSPHKVGENDVLGIQEESGYFSSCCSFLTQKVYACFTCCYKSHPSQQPLKAQRSFVSITSANQEKSPEISKWTKIGLAILKVMGHRYVVGTATCISAGTLIASATLLSPVYSEYSQACSAVLSGFTGDLVACRAPYEYRINLYQSLVATSCSLFGFILQKFWEIDPRKEQNCSPELVSPSSCFRRLKNWIAIAQRDIGYETGISLGYLYNGVWINTNDPNKWNDYFNCHSAAIGIASAFLGMYARIQWIFIRESFFLGIGNDTGRSDISKCNIRDNRFLLGISLAGAVMLGISCSSLLPSQAVQIAKDISIMVAIRPIGKFFADWINFQKINAEQNTNLRKGLVLFSACLKVLPTPLVALGYYSYLSSNSLPLQLTGMSLIGIAQGIKESCYFALQAGYDNTSLNGVPSPQNKSLSTATRVATFVKNYWKTAAVIAFSIIASEVPFLDCYDIQAAVCPLSFELSSNYIIVDSKGVNIVIAIGLIHYYARKLFKFLGQKPQPYIQKVARGYIHLTDKYQADLLSMVPYCMVKSGVYTPNYNTYASFDPLAVLVLVGLTFGTYKESVHSEGSDPNRPVFTDTAIVKGAILPLP